MKALPIDYLHSIESDPNLVVGRKWDGFSEIVVVEKGKVRLFNRSGKEHTKNVPSLTARKVGVPDCRIVAEGVGPDGTLKSTKSILGSKSERAITFQNEYGPLKLVCHNLVELKGEDLTRVPFGEKIPFLSSAILALREEGCLNVLQEQLIHAKKFDYFQKVLARGGEGVVVKSLRGFEEDFIKVKRVRTWDVVIVGFTKGRGKYADVVGAIRYGAYNDDGSIVEVGKCSGMTDEERVIFAMAQETYIGKVIELKGQEVGKDGRVRFPAFQRIRDDKLPTECLLRDLKEEL